MKRALFLMLSVLVIIIVNALAFGQKHPRLKSLFNADKASSELTLIAKKLSGKNGLSDLYLYVDRLDKLRDNASECVENAQSHLDIVNGLLKTTKFDKTVPVQQADLKYLQDKKIFYAKELSKCRLFTYRSEELLIDYRDKIQQLSRYKLLRRSHSVLSLLSNRWFSSFSSIDIKKVRQVSGIDELSFNQQLIGISFAIAALIFGFYLRLLCWFCLDKGLQLHISIRALLAVMQSMVVPVLFFATLSCFFNVVYDDLPTTPALELICHGILIYLLAYAGARYLFYPSATVPNLLRLPTWLGRVIHMRFVVLISWLLLSYVIVTLLDQQTLPPILTDTMRIVFITMFSILTLWFCLSWFSRYKIEGKLTLFASFAKVCLWLFFAAAIMFAWAGYHRLVLYVVNGLLTTVVLSLLALAVWRIIDACYESLDDRRYQLSRKLHVLFGVKVNKHIFEFSIVKFVVCIAVLCTYLVALMHTWQLSENWIDGLVSWVFSGFRVGNFHIIPARLLLAFIVFSALQLIGRFVSASIARRVNFQGEEDTQIAVSTIVIYISFAVAFIIALLVTGVDFTGLAIIAGALSVGIGLGLQGIVNNFVSGIILLLEKPIKPGDRIIVGNTEGFVKKIRIRSTQIATLAKEDVIVPNADLISQKVTNYMFRDRYWRVVCQVGVAYGSNVELVKQTLLEVAVANEDVVQDPQMPPMAFFKEFGDSSLIFELWCLIYDVNKKYAVMSDLNFAIDKAFRAHGITIAFPQRDLHIKDFKPGPIASAKDIV